MVIVSDLFSYYQDNKSCEIMESFAKMIPPKARVFSLSGIVRWWTLRPLISWLVTSWKTKDCRRQ